MLPVSLSVSLLLAVSRGFYVEKNIFHPGGGSEPEAQFDVEERQLRSLSHRTAAAFSPGRDFKSCGGTVINKI